MPEDDRLDPRYRPEFQRGYDPALDGSASARQPSAPVGDSNAAESAAAEKPALPSRPPTFAPVADDGVAPEAVDAHAAGPTASAPAPATPVWRNPYLIALLVVGLLLTVGGVQLFFRAIGWIYGTATSFSSATGPRDLVTPQVVWGLAPLITTAGMLTLLGVVFFVASRWTPGPRAAGRMHVGHRGDR